MNSILFKLKNKIKYIGYKIIKNLIFIDILKIIEIIRYKLITNILFK